MLVQAIQGAKIIGAPVITRYDADVVAVERSARLYLLEGLPFASLPGLSIEAQLRGFDAAQRVAGVAPAAVMTLLSHVRRKCD